MERKCIGRENEKYSQHPTITTNKPLRRPTRIQTHRPISCNTKPLHHAIIAEDPFVVVGGQETNGVAWRVGIVEFMVLAVVEEVPGKPGGGVDFYIGDCGTVEWDGVVKELQRVSILPNAS